MAQKPFNIYVTIHFQDPLGAAWLLYSNRADITVPMCEQKPNPVWFSCRRRSYPVYSEHIPEGGGGTPIHYLYGYVPSNGVVILKLLI